MTSSIASWLCSGGGIDDDDRGALTAKVSDAIASSLCRHAANVVAESANNRKRRRFELPLFQPPSGAGCLPLRLADAVVSGATIAMQAWFSNENAEASTTTAGVKYAEAVTSLIDANVDDALALGDGGGVDVARFLLTAHPSDMSAAACDPFLVCVAERVFASMQTTGNKCLVALFRRCRSALSLSTFLRIDAPPHVQGWTLAVPLQAVARAALRHAPVRGGTWHRLICGAVMHCVDVLRDAHDTQIGELLFVQEAFHNAVSLPEETRTSTVVSLEDDAPLPEIEALFQFATHELIGPTAAAEAVMEATSLSQATAAQANALVVWCLAGLDRAPPHLRVGRDAIESLSSSISERPQRMHHVTAFANAVLRSEPLALSTIRLLFASSLRVLRMMLRGIVARYRQATALRNDAESVIVAVTDALFSLDVVVAVVFFVDAPTLASRLSALAAGCVQTTPAPSLSQKHRQAAIVQRWLMEPLHVQTRLAERLRAAMETGDGVVNDPAPSRKLTLSLKLKPDPHLPELAAQCVCVTTRTPADNEDQWHVRCRGDSLSKQILDDNVGRGRADLASMLWLALLVGCHADTTSATGEVEERSRGRATLASAFLLFCPEHARPLLSSQLSSDSDFQAS